MQMNELYSQLWDAHGQGDFALLDQSLNPRPSALLYDYIDELGIGPADLILDAGCGHGKYACDLAGRYGARVIGIDPASAALIPARTYAETISVSDRVQFMGGLIQSIPLADDTVDLIWCRDILVHVAEIETSMLECARVLRPDGHIVVLATFTTDLLAHGEVEQLFQPLGIVSRSLSRSVLERSFSRANLQVLSFELIGGERLEYLEEHHRIYTRELMRLARMTRKPEYFIDKLGHRRFHVARSLYYWTIYLLIGKLTDAIYVLRR